MTVAEAPSSRSIRCPRCALGLDLTGFAGGALVDCPACRSRLRAEVYPAFENPPAAVSTSSGEHALDGEAACFFHPEKRAVLACEACGRFVCALCDVPLGTRHLCPTCLGTSKAPELIALRWCWANVALLVGIVPLVLSFGMWPVLFLSGPAAMFIALWSWNKPGSLVGGPRHWVAMLGLIGGVLQLGIIAGVAILIWKIIPHA